MPYMDDLIIKLEEIKDSFITDNNPNFIGLFLFGSQNYNLSNEESDIDCILLLRNSTGFSKEASTKYGKIKIYSLESFIKMLSRGIPQAYEILYTKYQIVNPIYKTILQNFVLDFSQHLDCEKVKAQLYKKLEEHFYNILWIVDKKTSQRYNKKRLYWAIRTYNQILRLNEGESLPLSFIYTENFGLDLMKIKSLNNFLSMRELNDIYRVLKKAICEKPSLQITVTPKEKEAFLRFYFEINKF